MFVIRAAGGKRCKCYVEMGVVEPWKYERLPAEITHHDHLLTIEDRAHLVQWATYVKTTDLCSRRFPLLIDNYTKKARDKVFASIRPIAERIAQLDAKRLHFSAAVVARVLWEYADWEPLV